MRLAQDQSQEKEPGSKAQVCLSTMLTLLDSLKLVSPVTFNKECREP